MLSDVYKTCWPWSGVQLWDQWPPVHQAVLTSRWYLSNPLCEANLCLLHTKRVVGRMLSGHFLCFRLVLYCPVPCSYLVKSSNVGGNGCLCYHVQHDHPDWVHCSWSAVWPTWSFCQYWSQGVGNFVYFLAMHVKMPDIVAYFHLQNYLIEHLWTDRKSVV